MNQFRRQDEDWWLILDMNTGSTRQHNFTHPRPGRFEYMASTALTCT